MYRETVSIDTTGSAGSATGSGSTRALRGLIYKINLNYSGSAPATTDVTITTQDEAGNTVDTILTITDSNTDANYVPKIQASDNTGTSIGDYVFPAVAGDVVNIAIAECDELTAALSVEIFWIPSVRVPTIEP